MTCCTRRAKPGFYQYETASLHIELDAPGVLNDTADVVLSIQQGTVQVDYHKDALEIDADASTIDVEMSQEDAGKFSAARGCAVQVNILYNGGQRSVSAVGEISVFANLYGQVLES